MDKLRSFVNVCVLSHRIDVTLLKTIGYPNDRESMRLVGTAQQLLERVDTSQMLGEKLGDVAEAIFTMLEFGMTLNTDTEAYREVAEDYMDDCGDKRPYYKEITEALKVREYLLATNTAAVLEK